MIGQIRRLILEPREVPLGGVRGMNAAHCRTATCRRSAPGARPVRSRRHQDAGRTASAHRTADGDLAARRRDPPPRLARRGRRRPAPWASWNLMTAGNGISHSEYSIGDGPVLDAPQFWVVLPDSARHGAPGFERHTALPALAIPAGEGADAEATVVLGEFAGYVPPPPCTPRSWAPRSCSPPARGCTCRRVPTGSTR